MPNETYKFVKVIGGDIVWVPFYVQYAAPGDGTPIPAVAGSAILIQELNVISGQALANTVLVKHGTVTVRELPTSNPMEGAIWDKSAPDYIKLPTNTALIVSRSSAGTVSVFGRYCYQAG